MFAIKIIVARSKLQGHHSLMLLSGYLFALKFVLTKT